MYSVNQNLPPTLYQLSEIEHSSTVFMHRAGTLTRQYLASRVVDIDECTRH